MSSIAKNIKELRTEKKISQDSLAQQIFVSRQAVSSWENGRTQPDIDMIISLSEVLGVPVEEIIYGKKRNVGLEADKSKSRHTLTVILAVLGSLFTAVGLIILFVYLWEEFPESVKGLFGYVPLLAGMAVGLFAYFKKRDSALWRESGGVMWIAGIAATNALINSIYFTDMGFVNLLLIDAVLILPIMFILDAVFPLTVFTALSITLPLSVWDAYGTYSGILIGLLLLTASAVFIIRDYKSENHRRYTVWFGIAAATAMIYIITCIIGEEIIKSLIIIILSALIFMLCVDKENGFPYPFRYTATVGISVITTAFTVIFALDGNGYSDGLSYIPAIIAGAAIIAAGTIIGRKTLSENRLKLAFTALSVIFIACIVIAEKSVSNITVAFMLLVCALGITVLIKGIKSARILTANLGIVMIIAMLWLMLVGLDIELVGIGVAFAVTGIVILTINKIMMTKFKRLQVKGVDESNA